MISVTKLRNGVNFDLNGNPHRVIEYKHTHKSRGGGSVKVKVRNLLDGSVKSKTFQSTEKVEEVAVSKRQLQYLYLDGEVHVFMDPISFEQLDLPKKIMGEQGAFLKEGEQVTVVFWDDGKSDHGRALGLDLVPKMTFVVAEAAPGERGDSTSNVYKDAVLENGLKVRVPLFVNKGDKIRVDTRSCEYVERA